VESRAFRASDPRWWDGPAALLLLLTLLTASGRLIATNWTDHLLQTQTLVFLGALAGLALGQSRFRPGVALFFALAYGLFFVPWQLGLTVTGDDLTWADRLLALSDRLQVSLAQLAARQDVEDPLLFLALMDALFWGLGAWAGYTLTRRGDAWRAVLPAGIAALVVQAYDPYPRSRAGIIALYLFFALFLWARTTYLHHRAGWQATRTPQAPFLGLEMTRAAFYVALGLVIVAWIFPAPADLLPTARRAWDRLSRPWNALREHLEPLFAPLRGGNVPVVGEFYGPHLPLGRGGERTETVILTVRAPSDYPIGVRFYWRARVYDRYADGLWQATFPADQPVALTEDALTFPGREGRLPEWAGRWTTVITYTTEFPISALYLAPQPVWVDLPVQADLAEAPDGTVDLAVLKAVPALPAGATYHARSALGAATVAQLRAAGTDYPQWVTERYLQLPPTVTPRMRELAAQIAAGKETPYDIAVAVTEYLRANIRYTPTVPPVPRGREPLDWFLFDLRRGFCNYYASAEVVLLRSLGIPARLAVGFASGKWEGGRYLVRDKDAHAWPEVYFPGFGWVEFEPTASQPPLLRPSGEEVGNEEEGRERAGLRGLRPWEQEEEIETPPEETETGPQAAPTTAPPRLLVWVLAVGGGAVLGYGVWRARRHLRGPLPVLLERGLERLGVEPPPAVRRWADYARLPPEVQAYLEINRALVRLGTPPAPSDTPAERGARLVARVPRAAPWVEELLGRYQAAVYGRGPTGDPAVRRAGRAIRLLSWQARLGWKSNIFFAAAEPPP
jgi:transglutaminase-like putative cysteine protease